MKKLILLAVTMMFFTGCFKSIEDDPEILYRTIKKHPKKFLDVLNEAAKEARIIAAKEDETKENEKREDEFKNPKKPEIDEGRVFFGDKGAKVTIVEYSDFQCHFCGVAHETMNKVLAEYKGKVRVLYKHLVLFGENSNKASAYYEAIGMQDKAKAKKFHDKIFEEQGKLKSSGENFLKEIAKSVGANMKKLTADLGSDKIKKIIVSDSDEGKKFGFSGTPGFLVNGITLNGAQPLPVFKEVIDRHLSN